MKTISAALLWCAALAAASAQAPPRDGSVITPRWVPAPTRVDGGATPARFSESSPAPPTRTTPIAAQGMDKSYGKETGDYDPDVLLRSEFPGHQTLFRRESEPRLYARIAQMTKKQTGQPAVFPLETPVAKGTRQPRQFAPATAEVEPMYVLHRRLFFEQPNFERLGYNLGILQPGVSLGVFYYDMAMLPYHFWQDLRDRSEGNLGKCLPGDQAPLRVPIERFSVTGAMGEVGAIIGGAYLFP